MSVVITPEDVKELVGEFDIPCASRSEDPKSTAVACVNITHKCPKNRASWVYMCERHIKLLEQQILHCLYCDDTLPYGEIVWL